MLLRLVCAAVFAVSPFDAVALSEYAALDLKPLLTLMLFASTQNK